MGTRCIVVGFSLLLAGCVRPPAVLSGGPFGEATVGQAQNQDLGGQRVRWGGTVVITTPGTDETCFEVVSRPLDAEARPRDSDQTEGRFVACVSGFYDPAIYTPGREITVVGTLGETTIGKIGDREYRFPRLAAEHVFLWPKREVYGVVYTNPWVEPFWYPWWGPWPAGPLRR